MEGPTSARSEEVAGFFGAVVWLVVLMCSFCAGPAIEGNKKTHDRFRPWVLVEIVI